MRISCFYALVAVCLFQTLKADNDTLSIAKTYIQQKKFKKAEKILHAFEQVHPNDLNTVWLYAQTAYWAGHNKTFYNTYEKAMAQFPSNYYLKLDYALKLVENGDVEKAKPLLELYKEYDPFNGDFKLAYAKITYWEGHYDAALQQLISEVLLNHKEKETRELREEILAAKSSWIRIGTDYLKDDQPLQHIIPVLEAGKYVNNLFSPFVSLQSTFLKSDSASFNAPKLSVGNKFNFYRISLQMSVHAGFIQLPNKANELLGGIELVKTYFKYLKLTALAIRQPYLTTVSSIYNTVVPYHYDFNIAWNNQNSWNGKLFATYDQYTQDKNYVYNFGAWVFAPPLKLAGFQFRIGYAFGYGSSKENRYISKEQLNTITSNYNSGSHIEGIYDPYFTPSNQQVHAGLLNIVFQSHKRITVGVNASIAFVGNVDDPYLFLDKNSKSELFINRGYSSTNFYPNKIDAFVLYKIAKKVSIKANYTFLKNNFYTSNMAGISVILNLWNDR